MRRTLNSHAARSRAKRHKSCFARTHGSPRIRMRIFRILPRRPGHSTLRALHPRFQARRHLRRGYAHTVNLRKIPARGNFRLDGMFQSTGGGTLEQIVLPTMEARSSAACRAVFSSSVKEALKQSADHFWSARQIDFQLPAPIQFMDHRSRKTQIHRLCVCRRPTPAKFFIVVGQVSLLHFWFYGSIYSGVTQGSTPAFPLTARTY